MSRRIDTAARDAPPTPPVPLYILKWFENRIRKPLEGTWLDTWVMRPAKYYYLRTKRLE